MTVVQTGYVFQHCSVIVRSQTYIIITPSSKQERKIKVVLNFMHRIHYFVETVHRMFILALQQYATRNFTAFLILRVILHGFGGLGVA